MDLNPLHDTAASLVLLALVINEHETWRGPWRSSLLLEMPRVAAKLTTELCCRSAGLIPAGLLLPCAYLSPGRPGAMVLSVGQT